jgi:hypothetical protein
MEEKRRQGHGDGDAEMCCGPHQIREKRMSSRIFTRKEIARCERIDERRLRFVDYLGMSGSSDTAYTTYYA